MKIEIEKPVIPQFVAEWLEQLYGQGFNGDDLLEALFTRNYDIAELKVFKWFTADKERAVTAILYGYEVEQPLYYAKIKGWEKSNDSLIYWNFEKFGSGRQLSVNSKGQMNGFETQMTKSDWNALGINDTNADFEEVE